MPNSIVDLHIHTYYSDGRAAPAEVLHYAVQVGLKTLAITDHDNTNAYAEAGHVAADLCLELLPGVELTCSWEACNPAPYGQPFTKDVDLLGYCFDPQDAALQVYLDASLQDVLQRLEEACARISRGGLLLSMDDLRQENPRYPGAMQMLLALVHKGLAADRHQARELVERALPSLRASSFGIEKAIAALHAAGGVAVLAHPVAVSCDGGWLGAAQVAELKEMGLDGIEVYHPSLDAEARRHFLELAQQFDLLVTGGSDEHGWTPGFPRLGSQPVSYESVQALREAALKWR
jgi:predicted metal-dependent phosphoesterase TrpH